MCTAQTRNVVVWTEKNRKSYIFHCPRKRFFITYFWNLKFKTRNGLGFAHSAPAFSVRFRLRFCEIIFLPSRNIIRPGVRLSAVRTDIFGVYRRPSDRRRRDLAPGVNSYERRQERRRADLTRALATRLSRTESFVRDTVGRATRRTLWWPNYSCNNNSYFIPNLNIKPKIFDVYEYKKKKI